MDLNIKKIEKNNTSNFIENKDLKNEEMPEFKAGKEYPQISDNIGFNKFFTLSEDENQEISPNPDEKEAELLQKRKKEEEELSYKISIDLTDINNKKLHNYLNEDLIDALDKCMDEPEPKNNQYISDLSPNENDTNYSQNNISNDIEMNNNCMNINNNFRFYPQSMNSIHNTISFFPKANKKKLKENEESNINNNNANNMSIKNENSNEKNKSLKKLVDYFGGSSPLDAPIYIPQKFKSLKFNQKPNKIGENEIYYNKNNVEPEKKEEKCKKPFEIREGDWTCEFCYNLNFAFRTKCNRCGVIKDFLQIKNNLSMNTNDNFQNYQNMMPPNIYFGNNQNSFPNFNNNDFSNNMLSSPNASIYH